MKMKKNFTRGKFLLETVAIFLIIINIATALAPVLRFMGAFIAAPLLAKYRRTRLPLKSSKYKLGLIVAIVVTFVWIGSTGASSDTLDGPNKTTTLGQNASESTTKPTIEPTTVVSVSQTVEPTTDVSVLPTLQPTVVPTQKVTPEPTQVITSTTKAKVHFINTGNSDAILIVQGDKSVLIDGGDNNDETLVTNYIKKQGIKKLTYVISTHPDADHCGGLDAVLEKIGTENLFIANGDADTKTYRDFVNAAMNNKYQPSVPLEGAKYNLSANSYIQIFNSNGGSSNNEASLVTLFVNGNDKMLFMGDAGSETENELMSKFVDVDLVKIGHHGSKSSTSQKFLNKINPEYAVILTGSNSYGHPTSTVLNRIKSADIELHRTDECGTIVFSSSGKGVSTSCSKASFTPGDSDKSSGGTGSGSSGNSSGSSNSSGSGNSSGSSNSGKDNNVTPTKKPVKDENTGTTSTVVYITKTGKKYHTSGCRYLSKSKIKTTLAKVKNSYEPCSKCNPPQ